MTNLKNQVAKCIRYAGNSSFNTFYRVLATALVCAVLSLHTSEVGAQPITLLNSSNPAQDISAASLL
jgi:hypothetical protein